MRIFFWHSGTLKETGLSHLADEVEEGGSIPVGAEVFGGQGLCR